MIPFYLGIWAQIQRNCVALDTTQCDFTQNGSITNSTWKDDIFDIAF